MSLARRLHAPPFHELTWAEVMQYMDDAGASNLPSDQFVDQDTGGEEPLSYWQRHYAYWTGTSFC